MWNISAIGYASTTLWRDIARLVRVMRSGSFRLGIHPNACRDVLQWKGEGAKEAVYDIVNAGPNNRFAVITPEGIRIVHNCLGLQYGMGKNKLAAKLSADTGREVSVMEADLLISKHKSLFRKYWAWQEQISAGYAVNPLELDGGWTLFKDNPVMTSVRNFPVQGTGARIMQVAIRKAQEKNLKVICPLHDAIYILHEATDGKSPEVLSFCMSDAVAEVLGPGAIVRQDSKTVRYDEVWIEKKGSKTYHQLKKYLEPQTTNKETTK